MQEPLILIKSKLLRLRLLLKSNEEVQEEVSKVLLLNWDHCIVFDGRAVLTLLSMLAGTDTRQLRLKLLSSMTLTSSTCGPTSTGRSL